MENQFSTIDCSTTTSYQDLEIHQLKIFKRKGWQKSADVDGKEIKVIKAKLNSLRLDTLLKAGLNIAKKYIYFKTKL